MADGVVAMRIIFFMQDTAALYGAERATLDLADGLRGSGDDPLFFLMQEERLVASGALSKAAREAGHPVRMFSVAGRIAWPLVRALREAWREEAGHVLHITGYKAHVHAVLAGIRPRVATVHGWLFRSDSREQFYGWLEKVALRRCDRVIALSSYYEQYLLRQGIKRKSLVRIPSGLRDIPSSILPVPRAGSMPPRSFTFGMLGRFSEEKNHAMFLRAADIIHRENASVRFIIAGAGPLMHDVKQTVLVLGLTDVTDFPGYQRVDDFFRTIDVYVMCSRIENLPYSILEAMAYGRPVLATRVGGIPDLVEDHTTGRLVDLDDAGGLATAMRELVADPETVVRMGAAGRRKLEGGFTLPTSIAAHQQLYRDVVAAPST